MADSHKPKQLTLVSGKIRRGDTIEAWPFKIAAIPSPATAIVKFSAHLDTLDSAPLIELVSPTDFTVTVEDTTVNGVAEEDVIVGTVPRINAPAVGKILWELQVRNPSLDVAGPDGAKWTRTIFDGSFPVIQDGADRTLP